MTLQDIPDTRTSLILRLRRVRESIPQLWYMRNKARGIESYHPSSRLASGPITRHRGSQSPKAASIIQRSLRISMSDFRPKNPARIMQRPTSTTDSPPATTEAGTSTSPGTRTKMRNMLLLRTLPPPSNPPRKKFVSQQGSSEHRQTL